MEWRDKRVFVSGGAGVIGTVLTEKLQQKLPLNNKVLKSTNFLIPRGNGATPVTDESAVCYIAKQLRFSSDHLDSLVIQWRLYSLNTKVRRNTLIYLDIF